ncbi:hypothetical protein FUAX_49450 (plasmid) [Fulvitalea axinellae]|uniref:Amine oxidase domain-containing protein n=1 Tax=Fulvitalea axinellae TaxID=1182444 RepID=A0AAU9CX34_9BACT|nr:hypothetical protein FUAX_49450 [Fulvitalea axinellae]
MSEQTLEVAIVGAGCAGAYTAWRLAKSGKYAPGTVKVFDFLKIDNQAHVGGRLLSKEMPGLGYTRKAELGGMRFLTSQKILVGVLEELGLEHVPFDVDSNHNLYDMRSKVMKATKVAREAKDVYDLSPPERDMSPGELLLWAVETVVPHAPFLDSEGWLEAKKNIKFDGRNLYDTGFWNLLQRVLSSEGYDYVLTGQGYNTIPSNWNAADAIEWMFEDFGPNVSYRYVHKGFQTVPKTLLEKAVEGGVVFEENRKLKRWEKNGDGTVTMTFENTDSGEEIRIKAKKMVLAMPRRALELVDMPKDNEMDTFYNELLPAVEPQPMFKFFLGYDLPWWRSLGISFGRTITDNPLRQIYYWGVNDQKFFKTAPEKTGNVKNLPANGVIMIYLDGRDVSFWQPLFELISIYKKTLNIKDEKHFGLMEFSVDEVKAKVKEKVRSLKLELDAAEKKYEAVKDFGAEGEDAMMLTETGILFARAKRNFEKVLSGESSVDQLIGTISELMRSAHGLQFIPDPYAISYADWTVDPFGGAYNLWKPGFRSWEVTQEMIKPFGNVDAYVVGEAYSLKQGWVEGAFETSEQMLEKYFSL